MKSHDDKFARGGSAMKRTMVFVLTTLLLCSVSQVARAWSTDNGFKNPYLVVPAANQKLVLLRENAQKWIATVEFRHAADISPIFPDHELNYYITTHPYLTYKIIKLFEQETGVALPFDAMEAIVWGSIEEDYDVAGTSNRECECHVEPNDVLSGTGGILDGLNPVFNRSFNHFLGPNNAPLDGWPDYLDKKILCDPQRSLSSLVDWAIYAPDNLANLNRINAICPAVSCGDLPEFWRNVGHILHLLEDVSSPAHVRNDPHPGGDAYEEGMKNETSYGHEDWIAQADPNESINLAGANVNENIRAHFEALAEHTRNNYFSNDTIFSDELPVVVTEDHKYVYNQFGKKIAYKGAMYWSTYVETYLALSSSPLTAWSASEIALQTARQHLTINPIEVVGDGFSDLGAQAIRHGAAVLRVLYDKYQNNLLPDNGISRLPDTGQTTCYNNPREIVCPTEGQAFYGQDANYSINPLSYTVHSNGTVTDNVTGLVWQREDDNTPRGWDEAIAYCQDLGQDGYAGYNDWRLPSNLELLGIVNYEIEYPGPTINTEIFLGTNFLASYWSSTILASSSPAGAFYVNFASGKDLGAYKHDSNYVRCVRGAIPSGDLNDHGNGTVTDNRTGLMWQQDGDAPLDWEGALSYCQDLYMADHDDWRLPNIKELESIVDSTRISKPAIDLVAFPNTPPSSWYWSSTAEAGEPSYAWYVYFGYGYASNNSMNANYNVRCVRGGIASSPAVPPMM